MPVAVRGIAVLPAAESLAMTRAPFAVPVDGGANWTFKVADSPGGSVLGKVSPEAAKPGPETVNLLMVTGAEPADVSVSDWVAVAVNATFPNEAVFEFTVRSAAGGLLCRTASPLRRITDVPPDCGSPMTVSSPLAWP